MPLILSITGLLKTVLIIIGVFVALKFLGQLMIAKRNFAEQSALKDKQNRLSKERKFVEENKGKITISKAKNHDALDVDYEEIK